MMDKQKYSCVKCGNWKADFDEIRTTGSGFSKLFNIQNRRFTAVICSQCGFTEFYSGKKSSGVSNVLDFLTN